MTMKSSRNLEQEFERYIARLDEYVPGFKLRYFRAPYGSRNDFVRETAAQFGLQHVLWTIESGGNDRQTIHNVLDRVQAGSIVLSHAHRKFDYREADTFVRELMRRGYQLENLTTGRSPADIYPGSSITTREPSSDLVQYRG
jgi:peptidoglycan/xylan/chitin deacetylase (PgdA/CDA1 family)